MIKDQIQRFSAKHILIQTGIMALGWLFLTKGSIASWIIGIPTIFLALKVNSLLPTLSGFTISLKAIVPFLFFFIRQSINGGVDVASRAFRSDMGLSAAFIRYKFKTSNQIARLYFINTVSLLPGTLSADYEDNEVVIHLLDQKLNNRENLNRLEEKIAALFGERITR